MAGELGAMRDGLPLSLVFVGPAIPANATTNLTGPQLGTGYVVPTSYQFHPMLLAVNGTLPVTAQSITFNVTDNGVAIANTPTVLLSTVAPTQRATGLARLGITPIAAGHVVGVNAVTPAGYTQVASNWDVTLSGVLEPV